MKRRQGLLGALALSVAACGGLARAQSAPPPPAAPSPPKAPLGELKQLGPDRFQVGHIVVDKRAGRFSVPGRVHVTGKPLEYLATSPGGMKAYETLFELDATGSEFNLACILIGLERDPRTVAAHRQNIPAPLIGPRVAISVAWVDAGKRRQMPAAQALLNPEAEVKPESVEWVYIGAPASQGANFAADITGTLVGFKPDENNVIQSAVGIGIGAYGSVRGHAVLPPIGSAIELIVEAARAAK